MKRKHTINMFPITNLDQLDFSFKLISFDWSQLKMMEEHYHQNVNKLAMKISSRIQGPCALYHFNGEPHFAIPEKCFIKDQKINVGPLQISIKNITNDYDNILSLQKISDQNISVIQQFLEFIIKEHLNNHLDLWNFGSNQYFLKEPIKKNEDGNIDVFGGFKFKVVRELKKFYVVLDVNYKYLSRGVLSDQVNKSNARAIIKGFRGVRCLYMNGDNWYTVVVEGFADNINVQKFNGQTIFDYIKEKNINAKFNLDGILIPDSISVLYKYPGRAMEPHTAAACLARIIYKTDHPDVRQLHNKSALVPQKRLKTIKNNICRFLTGVNFNGKTIMVSDSPIVKDASFFKIPSLKFNNNQILSLNGKGTERISFHDYGIERKKMILENGIINSGTFDPQYLLVPSYMDREKVKSFKEYFEKQTRSIAGSFKGFTKVVKYKVLNYKSATHQVAEIKQELDKQNISSGFALFILPNFGPDYDYKVKNLHDCLKNKFYPEIKFQCASEFRISSFYRTFTDSEGSIRFDVLEKSRGKFKSYIFNLITEYLLLNRKWPYALQNNLNYDIYIGIDVHERYAGFSFFYRNGEHIYFDAKRVPKKTGFKRTEKIRASEIEDILYNKLKSHIEMYCENPNGIVIIRDGRSYGEEEKALKQTINRLIEENIINQDRLNFGVVDLHKQSATPLRITSGTNGYDKYENPRSGSFFIIDNEGYIFSTGFPFKVPGSVKPICVSVASGSLELLKVMEDIYHQCMLAFSAPDRSNSIPISIKLIDSMIQPLANEVEDLIDDDVEILENQLS